MSLDLNLADLTLPDEAGMEVTNKHGAATGWTWFFAGPGHPATIAADERQAKRLLAVMDEQERTRVNGRKWKGTGDTPEDIRERTIEYIAARLLRWTDGMTLDGQPFPCTPENARKMLSNPALGIYEQANDFLRDERSFTKRSPQT